MSEYRFDPYNGIWVAIATIRGERPHEYRQLESRAADAVCPFCRGHESQTPPALLELSAADLPASFTLTADPSWLVRVVPNKYPALTPVSSERRATYAPYRQKLVGGEQEILIESPRHVASLSELSPAEMFLTLRAMQLRIAAAQADPHVHHVSVFKNCRPEAGASLEHAHSQLVYSRFAAEAIVARWRHCDAYWRQHQIGLLDAIRDSELNGQTRVLATDGAYASFCPFASRFPYQVWIVPLDQNVAFEQVAAAPLMELGNHLRASIERLEGVRPRAPYNMLLHLPPLRSEEYSETRAHGWLIEIVPRLGRFAGYELMGAGWINETPPELAAQQLRSIACDAARSVS